MKPILVILEGHDNTGKDTLLDQFKNEVENIYIYKQPTHEDIGINKADKEKYQKWLYEYIDKQLTELEEIGKKYPIIMMTRLITSDNVFSDMFNRSHIVNDNFKDRLFTNFNVFEYCLLWENYNEYVKRCKLTNKKIDFDKKQFDLSTTLFLKYLNENGIIKFINENTTKQEVLCDFLLNFSRVK